MKKKVIVGNWKENKTSKQAIQWLREFHNLVSKEQVSDCEVVLCPSFGLLSLVSSEIDALGLRISLGSQDFPAYSDGAYTGEESPYLLKEFIQYAIIGHSERREYFHEDDELLDKKVFLSLEHGIQPIFCVQDENTHIPDGVSLVAYEPVSAIGTGVSDSPEHVEEIAEHIQSKTAHARVLYGGSVNEENKASFFENDVISGVLVGSASLDPQSFFQILQK